MKNVEIEDRRDYHKGFLQEIQSTSSIAVTNTAHKDYLLDLFTRLESNTKNFIVVLYIHLVP